MEQRTRILKRNFDKRGCLVAIEAFVDIPFEIKRVFYIYDVPEGQTRGGHAHVNCKQFIVAVNGSFNVHVSDEAISYLLDLPDYGIFIDVNETITLSNFSEDAVCLVLASELFELEDYIYEVEHASAVPEFDSTVTVAQAT